MIRFKLYIFVSICAVAILLTTGCKTREEFIPEPIPDRVQVKLRDPMFSNYWAGTILQIAYDKGANIMSFTLPLPVFYDGFNSFKNTEGKIVREHEIFFSPDGLYIHPYLLDWGESYYKSDIISNDQPLTLGTFSVDIGLYTDRPYVYSRWEKLGSLNLNQHPRYEELQLQRGKIYNIFLNFDPNDINIIDFTYDGYEVTPKER